MAYFNPFEKITGKSDLAVRLNVNQVSLESLVNEILPETLFKTDEIGGKRISVTAKKSGKISFTFSGFSIGYQVPLEIEIKKKLAIGDLIAQGLLVLDFKTEIDISSDWNLKTKTEFQKYNWITTPRFKAGFMNFPIESIADLLIKKASDDLVETIDNQIVRQLDLKSRVEWGVKKISHLPISKSPEVSFFSKFEKLEISPMSSTPLGEVICKVATDFFPSIFIGDKQEVFLEEPSLPVFQKEGSNLKVSNISLPVFITFPELEKNIRARVIGESFSSGNNEATIEDLKIFKKYKSIVVDAELSGSFEGRFILSAEPRFDRSVGHIVLENLTFDLKTDNFLMKSVGWMFKKVLKKKIRENVEAYLKKLDQELLKIAKNGIEKMPMPKGVDLKIELEKLEINNLELEDAGISILSNTSGEIMVNVKPDQLYSPPR